MKIRIVKNRGIAYIPKEIRGSGYHGDVKLTPSTFAILMEKPGATTEDIIKSLGILTRHYKALEEKKCN